MDGNKNHQKSKHMARLPPPTVFRSRALNRLRYGGEVHWAQQGVEGDGSGGPKVLGVAEAVNQRLGGGFKYFLFSSLFREMIQFDYYCSTGLKPPARRRLTNCLEIIYDSCHHHLLLTYTCKYATTVFKYAACNYRKPLGFVLCDFKKYCLGSM